MQDSPLRDLIIRTGVVREPGVGYIYACNPEMEAEEIPHAITFRWKAGRFIRGEANYDAHTACLISDPSPGLVNASGDGYFSIITPTGNVSGRIFDKSQPKLTSQRFGDFSSLAEIAGKAHIVGHGGMVYRLDQMSAWSRIDDGLPDSFDVEAIDGFSVGDLFAVGFRGELWNYRDHTWVKRDLPTNVNLNAVACAGDGKVYIGGAKGVLIVGRGSNWMVIDHQVNTGSIWDLQWFNGKLYVAAESALYCLSKDQLDPVDFGRDTPSTFYRLSAATSVLWSVGEKDVMSFDGKSWARVV